MKSLAESLFDKDIITNDLVNLYNLFGSHVVKFKDEWHEGLGWTHYFDRNAVVRQWKKEGRLDITGGYARTMFPPDLKKFMAVILNNTIITKKQLQSLKIGERVELNCRDLNDKLDEYGIIADAWWGSHNPKDFKTYITVSLDDCMYKMEDGHCVQIVVGTSQKGGDRSTHTCKLWTNVSLDEIKNIK